jgi:hypothetical protein
MSLLAAWDVLGVSLVLSLVFLGPFAFGVSLMAWSGLRPSRPVTRKTLGVTLGALVCLAPVLLFPGFSPG